MKSILLIDTHWLWYATGMVNRKARVDYLALKNYVIQVVTEHYGSCSLFRSKALVSSRNRSINNFLNLLHGFGYGTETTENIISDINKELTHSEDWELAILAIGNFEIISKLKELKEIKNKHIALITYDDKSTSLLDVADLVIKLNSSVLYEKH